MGRRGSDILIRCPSIWSARSLSSHHFCAHHPILRDIREQTKTTPHTQRGSVPPVGRPTHCGGRRWVTWGRAGGNSHGNGAWTLGTPYGGQHPKEPTLTPQRTPHRAPQPLGPAGLPGLSIVPVLVGGICCYGVELLLGVVGDPSSALGSVSAPWRGHFSFPPVGKTFPSIAFPSPPPNPKPLQETAVRPPPEALPVPWQWDGGSFGFQREPTRSAAPTPALSRGSLCVPAWNGSAVGSVWRANS